MMVNQKLITTKIKALYGKNWQKVSRKNSQDKPTGIYVDKKAVDDAQKKYDNDPTKENRRNL